MEYIAIPSGSGNSINGVEIVHKGRSLRWNMSTYTRFKLTDPAVLFREINPFWARQTEEIQDRVFMIYWFIYRVLDDPMNVLTLTLEGTEPIVDKKGDLQSIYNKYIKESEELAASHGPQERGNVIQRDCVEAYLGKLYQLITAKDTDDIVAGMTIIYANTMTEKVPETNRLYPDTGRTHTRSDYNALVSFAIRNRPALPIFGHCMHVYQDKRKSDLKESSIISQLQSTDLFEMPAAIKLRDFMEASIKQFKKANVTTVNGGIGIAELADWCLAKATFRRVACGEIDSHDGQSSIVTNVFNYIEHSVLESVNRKFGPVSRKARPDEREGGGGKGEDNQSIIEAVKAREGITRGRRRMINVFARNTIMIAKRIDPTVPLDLIKARTLLTPEKLAVVPHPVQDGLIRWVMSAATHRFGDGGRLQGSLGLHHNVDYLRREELALYTGIAQAVLEHWGYIEMAALLEAVAKPSEGIVPTAAMWADDAFAPDVLSKLVDLFPYEVTGTRKVTSIEERNVGARDAREMTTMISTETWAVRKGAYTDRITADRDGFLVFPPGFVNQVAELLIRCCDPING